MNRFFLHLLFQLVLGCFFVFLAVLLVGEHGWAVPSFFCCIFGAYSFYTAWQMYLTFRAVVFAQKKLEEAAKESEKKVDEQ